MTPDPSSAVLATFISAWEAGREPPPADPADVEKLRHARAVWEAVRDGGHASLLSNSVPAAVGHFRIERELGRGGFGVVYLAYDAATARAVAVKVPLLHVLTTPAARQRFVREAELAAPLDHPNVVTVYEAGEAGPLPYIAMAYVAGPTLAEWLHENNGRPIPVRSAAEVMAQIADGVQHAHARGVLHRDLKPGNVLLQTGDITPGVPKIPHAEREENLESPKSLTSFTPRITDFGLGRAIADGDGLSRTGDQVGTANYMAPEQAAGQRAVSVQTDVWALGAILYELLTGRPPFAADSSPAVLQKVLNEEVLRPRLARHELSADLQAVCLKCLEKSPAHRYASAEAVADDLRHFLAGEATLARPVGTVQTAWRWAKRRPAPVAAGVLALVILIAGPVAAIRYSDLNQVMDAQAETEQAIRKLAETREAATLTEVIRRENYEHTPGWTERNRESLKRRAGLDVENLDAAAFRTDLATTLAGAEWKEVAQLLPKVRINDAAYSDDGKYFALGHNQVSLVGRGKVTLFDAKTLSPINEWKFKGHPVVITRTNQSRVPDGARSLVFAPDGKFLYVGSRSGWVHQIDLTQTLREAKEWRAHSTIITMCISPDGKRLFTVSGPERQLKSWATDPPGTSVIGFDATDSDEAEPRVSLNYLGQQILFTIGADLTHWLNPTRLKLEPRRHYPEARQNEVLLQQGWATSHFAIATKPEIFISASNELWVGDARHWVRSERLATHGDSNLTNELVWHIALDPQGQFAAIALEHEIVIWDLLSGAVVCRLTPPAIGGYTRKIVFSPDGRQLIAPGEPTAIYELNRSEVETPVALQGIPVQRFALAENSQGVATLSSFDESEGRRLGTLLFEKDDGSSRQIIDMLLNGALETELAMSTDGNRCLWGDDQYRTKISTLDHSLPILNLTLEQGVTGSGQSYSFDPDAQHFWAARGARVVRHSATTGEINLTFPLPRTSGGINQVWAITSRAQYLLAANRDGHLDVIDPKTAKLQLTYAVSQVSLTTVALSRDETLAMAGTLDGRVVCIGLPEGKEVAAFTPHTGRVNSIALSPDKSLMATAGNDGKLRLWTWNGTKWDALVDLPTGRKLVKQVHIDAVGKKLYVLLAGERGVRVWHLDKLKEAFDQYGVGW